MSARPDRLWPVLSVLVGLLSGVGGLETYAREREGEPIVIEIHGEGAVDDAAPDVGSIGEGHARARTAAQRGDVDGAIRLLEAELVTHPDGVPLLLELGHWKSIRGASADAIASLERARMLSPKDARILFEVGAAKKRSGDVKGAEADLRAALLLNPSHSSARVSLGDLLRRRGAIPEAILVLEPATRSGGNDDRARACVALGRARLAAKQEAEAERSFESAINWAPASPEVRAAIARSRLDAGGSSNAALALRSARLAAEMAPDLAPVLVTLGRALEANGLDREAFEAYQRSLRLDPSDRYARIRLIRLALGRSDGATARVLAEQLVSDAPEAPEHHFLLGLVAARGGRASEARAAYEASIARSNGVYPEAFFNLGLLEAKEGRAPEAIAAYESAISQRPDYVEAHNNLGLVHRSLKDFARAEEAFGRALDIDPGYSPAWLNLGMTRSDFGRSADAFEAFERAVSADPKGKKARLELGVAYARANRLGRAIETYEELLRLEPRYVKALYNLAIAYEEMGAKEQALEKYLRAIDLDAEHTKSRRRLAALALDLGRIELARSAALELLEREPSSRTVRILLARAQAHNHEVDACESSVRLAGPDPDATNPEADLKEYLTMCRSPTPRVVGTQGP
ncbi:MAG: tetratricopeptide repeat protein [Deltaproteobacteria bacterium]|nr:tetratricopeptide repeat protein [Deltaproteobacteria bacterium]